jgi:hypothetical protein
MRRQVLGLLALVLLSAGCTHTPATRVSAPTGTPVVDKLVLRNYATTADSVSKRLNAISQDLRSCVGPTQRCVADAEGLGAVATYLVHQLSADDTFRENGTTALMPPGISPLVINTESDARKVKDEAHSVSAGSSKVAITRLAHRVRTLAADVNEWQPGGQAAAALAAVHVSVPNVPAAKLPAK